MNNYEIDLLKKIEDLTARLNELFSHKTKPLISRYPLVFTFLIIIGATMVSQGIKEMLLKIDFFWNYPLIMLSIGVIILILTGTLYKKLDK